MMKIKSLEKMSFDMLYEAFSEAFVDYSASPMTRDALQVILVRRGYSAKHSFGAFAGDKLVSFTFNGVGEYKGIPTAYDTGTGTIKEFRGQKIATQVIEEAIVFLKKKGIKQYLLEVLTTNTIAFNMYKNLGFEVSREFNYYHVSMEKLKNIVPLTTKEGYSIRERALIEQDIISSFWDFEPSWQNSIESVNRKCEDFKALGVYYGNHLVGYGIMDSNSGDITQLAVAKEHRRQGIGTMLMTQMININEYDSLKVLNTEKGYMPMEKLLDSLNIPLAGYQYEMIKKL